MQVFQQQFDGLFGHRLQRLPDAGQPGPDDRREWTVVEPGDRDLRTGTEAAIVQGAEGITVKPYGATLFAFAAVIMVSSVFLSLTGWAVRRRLRRFGVQA